MFNRVISRVLLTTVLLVQWATAAQCHCRHIPGHQTNSHVHLADFPFTGQTVVHESRGHGWAHNDGDDDETDEQDSPAVPHDESQHHDADGILIFPTPLAYGWFTGRSSSVHEDAVCSPVMATCENHLMEEAPSLVRANLPAPFLTVPDRPTFLRQKTLLI